MPFPDMCLLSFFFFAALSFSHSFYSIPFKQICLFYPIASIRIPHLRKHEAHIHIFEDIKVANPIVLATEIQWLVNTITRTTYEHLLFRMAIKIVI